MKNEFSVLGRIDHYLFVKINRKWVEPIFNRTHSMHREGFLWLLTLPSFSILMEDCNTNLQSSLIMGQHRDAGLCVLPFVPKAHLCVLNHLLTSHTCPAPRAEHAFGSPNSAACTA